MSDEPVRRVPENHIGTELQAARLEQGRELAEIAHQTRVPLRHLTAIEAGAHDTLPALPYTVGFVKAFASAVGLDPAAAATRFRRETTKVPREPTLSSIQPIDVRRTPPRGAALLGILLVAIVALGVIGYAAGWFGGDNEAEIAALDPLDPSAPPPAAAPPATAPPPAPSASPPATTTAAADAPAPVGEAGSIVITARNDAWVRIYESGSNRALMQGIMEAGQTYEVPADRSDLLLWTGRAGELEISVGGTPLPPLGDTSDTVRDVPLTAAGLRAAASPQEG